MAFSRGRLATNLPLLPRRLQLSISVGVDLLLTPGEHVLRRDVADRTVQADVVVMLDVALHQTPRIFQRLCQCWCAATGCSKPVPFFDRLPFHFDNSPACPSTRQTLDGLVATMFASSIINATAGSLHRAEPGPRSEFPKRFFSATCSAIGSARTSSLVWIIFSRGDPLLLCGMVGPRFRLKGSRAVLEAPLLPAAETPWLVKYIIAERFVDSKELINKFLESRNRKLEIHIEGFSAFSRHSLCLSIKCPDVMICDSER